MTFVYSSFSFTHDDMIEMLGLNSARCKTKKNIINAQLGQWDVLCNVA